MTAKQGMVRGAPEAGREAGAHEADREAGAHEADREAAPEADRDPAGARAGPGVVADRLHSAAIHLLRRLRVEDVASGLTPPRLSALSVIVFGGPLTLGELAAAEQVRPPTITKLVRDLESAELVRLLPDPNDGRVRRVEATPAGRRVLLEGRLRRVDRLARDLTALPADELDTVARAVTILEEILLPEGRPGPG
jgi:DNA-binding MarR family transcriptional regulator